MKRTLLTFLVALLVAGTATFAGLPRTPAARSSPAGSAVSSGQVASLRSAHDQAVVDLLVTERRLADAQGGLDREQARLAEVDAELARTDEVLAKATEDLAASQTRLAERVRETYKAGHLSWIDLLMQSRSLAAFVDRFRVVSRVLGQEADLTQQVGDAKARAEEARTELRAARDAKASQVERLAQRRSQLSAARADQAKLAARLGSQLEAARQAAQAAAAKMAAANASSGATVQSASGTDTPSNSSAGSSSGSSKATTRTTKAKPSGGGSSSGGGGSAGSGGGSGQGSSGGSHTGKTLRVKCTAYAEYGFTYTGVRTGPGIIATDPRVIPLGTRVYVPGWGEGIAADTGGDIKGNWIDVWLPSQQEALDWGVKHLTITILD